VLVLLAALAFPALKQCGASRPNLVILQTEGMDVYDIARDLELPEVKGNVWMDDPPYPHMTATLLLTTMTAHLSS
jgi:hypothetical protein